MYVVWNLQMSCSVTKPIYIERKLHQNFGFRSGLVNCLTSNQLTYLHCLLFTFYHILAFEDLVVQFYDKKVSTHDLLLRLNMTSGRFDVRNICPSFQYSCDLVCPLDTEEQERDLEKPCYCDKLCVELGDCCYDYFSRLVDSQFFSISMLKIWEPPIW